MPPEETSTQTEAAWAVAVNERLSATLLHSIEDLPPLAKTITRQLMDAGGKRIRPLLFLDCCLLWGELRPVHWEIACCLELLHNATLLHDDAVDQSLLRRGQKSVYATHGERVSVAVGNCLFAAIFQKILACNLPELVHAFNWCISELSRGEMQQWLQTDDWKEMTPERYWQSVDGKTACLFEMITWMSLRLSAPENLPASSLDRLIPRMRACGKYWGRLFQLGDDVCDYTGSLGKTVGDDLREHKLTLPLLYAIEADPKTANHLVPQAFADPASHFPAVYNWIRDGGAADRIQQTAQSLADQAQLQLEYCAQYLPLSLPAKARICAYTRTWVQRTAWE